MYTCTHPYRHVYVHTTTHTCVHTHTHLDTYTPVLTTRKVRMAQFIHKHTQKQKRCVKTCHSISLAITQMESYTYIQRCTALHEVPIVVISTHIMYVGTWLVTHIHTHVPMASHAHCERDRGVSYGSREEASSRWVSEPYLPPYIHT